MKQIIQKLTQHFIEPLPENDFYKIENFGTYGYPDFLIQHLQYNLQAEVKNQFKLPSSNWVNVETDEVQQTHHLFLNALLAEARLPAESAYSFIEKSVTQVLNILVRPRKEIPEMLFGHNNVLSKTILEEKIGLITVYSHFGQVLSSYMNRKQHDELTKEQCLNIITNVDEKLTQNYSPPQWGNLLNPLFLLMDNNVDSRLIQLFFEDKQQPIKANAFSQKNTSLGREGFVEVLELLNSSEIEKILAGDTADEDVTIDPGFNQASPNAKNEDLQSKEHKKEPHKLNYQDSNGFAPAVADNPQIEENSAGEKAESSSINTDFSGDENQNKSLNDLFVEKPDKEINRPEYHAEVPIREPENRSQIEDMNIPIWKRFTSDNRAGKSINDTTANGGSEELSANINEHPVQLKQHLESRQQFFINELFGGSKSNYDASVTKIAARQTWQDAALTIRDDIFEKHNINIYSPAAVTFTDQLQNYFEKHR